MGSNRIERPSRRRINAPFEPNRTSFAPRVQRQKRNDGTYAPTEGAKCSEANPRYRLAPGCRLSPGGAPGVLGYTMHARPGTLRKIKSACGPGVYLRCSTSGAKHYASVLSCNHPTAPLMFNGIRDCGLEWSVVYTLAHAADLLHARYATRVLVSNTWTGIFDSDRR